MAKSVVGIDESKVGGAKTADGSRPSSRRAEEQEASERRKVEGIGQGSCRKVGEIQGGEERQKVAVKQTKTNLALPAQLRRFIGDQKDAVNQPIGPP